MHSFWTSSLCRVTVGFTSSGHDVQGHTQGIVNQGSSLECWSRELLLGVNYILPTLTNFWSPALHKSQATFNHQLFQRSELKQCGLKVQVMHHVSRLSGGGQSLQANRDTYIRQGIPEAQRSPPRTQRQSPNLFV